MFTKLSRKEEGFTLIELLVVVAIIALLAAFAVPRLFDAITTARKAPGTADVQTIASAIERYNFEEEQSDGTQRYPASPATLVGKYLKNGTQFTNGFGNGYIYLTDSTGTWYMLIDPANADQATHYQVLCDMGTTATTDDITVATALEVKGSLNVQANVTKVTSPNGCLFMDTSGSTAKKVPDSTVVTY